MVGSIHDMDFLSPCIYLITSPSNKIYIGQTIDINKRLKDYRNYKGVKFQNKLFHSFNKYGYENHIINILLWCKDRKELNFWEKFYVKLFNTYQSEYGLNLTSGGDSKYEVSDSTKEKLRIANIGKKQSEETKQKKREISIKNGNKPPKMIWTEERSGLN
jgi:group I intron endonuclease